MAIAVAQNANSLAYTKWLCKCHVVFASKHRGKAICNQYRRDMGEILGQLCRWEGVEMIEGSLMPDHARMLTGIPPKISVSSLVGCLKGKTSPPAFDRRANLRHEFGNRGFWAEGHCVFTVGLDEATIAKRVRGRSAPKSRRAGWAPGSTRTPSRGARRGGGRAAGLTGPHESRAIGPERQFGPGA